MAAEHPIFDSVLAAFRQPGAENLYRTQPGSRDASQARDRAVRVWRTIDWNGMLWAVVIVAAATAIGWPLCHKLNIANTNILMLYLVAVLWVATHHSLAAAVLTSLLGVLAFDFTFVPPYYTFSVHDQQYLVTFTVMLLTAVLIGALTHRVRAQAQTVREAWERAEAEFLRNTLLSGVSHELRTPLAGITGAASALTDAHENLSNQSKREMLETICTEAERMERLINNLLDMTRLESGGLVLKKEWQPLVEAVGAALHHLDRRLRGRSIRTDLAADLPLVCIDSVGVQQVLVNLIDNAVQHTPADSPIEISAKATDRQITIEVADHGPGLKPGTEERIFEKFVRIHPAGTHRGFGLGLAICRGIVEAHGGTINALNRSGGSGAIFRFTLPIDSKPPFIDSSE